MPFGLPPDVVIIGGTQTSFVNPPLPPEIDGIEYDGSVVNVYATSGSKTGGLAVVSMQLQRAPTSLGPWTVITSIPLDLFAERNVLTDQNPVVGIISYYQALQFDSDGNASTPSEPILIAPFVSDLRG